MLTLSAMCILFWLTIGSNSIAIGFYQILSDVIQTFKCGHNDWVNRSQATVQGIDQGVGIVDSRLNI